MPANNLPLIQTHLGKKMVVRAEPSGGGDPGEGMLSFVDNAVDTSTGTILLKGRFPNDDGSLWPGGFVNVRLQLYVEPDALVVPSTAVVEGQQGSFVFVIQPDSSAGDQGYYRKQDRGRFHDYQRRRAAGGSGGDRRAAQTASRV